MTVERTVEPSPDSVARANRQRAVREEGARALADANRRAIEVRLNVQRLRPLREARLAGESSARVAPPPPKEKAQQRECWTRLPGSARYRHRDRSQGFVKGWEEAYAE
jgi:hypothetical protein